MDRSKLLILAPLAIAATGAPTHAVEGRWYTEGNKAIVTVAPCGKLLCGTITWAAPVPATGKSPQDIHNRNPALRTRPLIGIQILSGFKPSGARWTGGTIYNLTNGKTYSSELALGSDGVLKVSGCVLVFCQTQNWKRAR